MGLNTCCSFLHLRRKKGRGITRRERFISLMPQPSASHSRSPSPLLGTLPPIASSPFKLSPFKTSSAVPSPAPSPERRASVASSPAFRRPSSTLAPSPRYLTRDTSRFSSFETAPLARSSPGLAYHQDAILVACEIWEEAYEQVRGDETLKSLVKNYEELFSIVASDNSFGSRRPSRAQKEPIIDDDENLGAGEEYFARLAQEYLDLARRDTANQGIVSAAVQFIQRTRDAVGLALVSSPPASIAWTGICTIVLPIIVNHAEQIAAREAGFSYVMSRFTWYSQVLDLLNREYWKSPHSFSALRHAIHDEIVALYKLLIEYHLRAYYTYCRPLTTISRDILKLDDWRCMVSGIKESERRLEDYMTLNYEQHLLDKLHTLSEDALHKQRTETLLKFKFSNDLPYAVYQAYLDSIDCPQDGTGAGVLMHPAFVSWATGDSGVFLLEGIPGSGKSVLSKSLLTELPKRAPTSVCAFFFKDNGKGQNAATTALCRVLDELFRDQPHLVDMISAKTDHLLPEEVRCNFNLLWSILKEATQDCAPGSVTIILDGFDECEPDSADKLCSVIADYLASPTPRLKFFLTTRPLVSTPQLISSPDVAVLKLEEDPHCLRHISKDIESVVIARFDGFALRCIQDPVLRRELLEIIRPREDRTYLYVKLLFDYLELRMRDGVPRVPRGWIEVFRKLPTTVKEAYVGFLNRVRESQRDDVRKLFQIVLAAARPLTLQEVNIALNIRGLPNGSKHGLDLQHESCFRSWILDACKYFLDVYNGRVYFIHQSAKDFLLAGLGEIGHKKPVWLGDFTMEACHTSLAESCILYLSLPLRVPSKFKGVDKTAEYAEYHLWDDAEISFASYAHLFWRSHVQMTLNAGHSPNQQGLLDLVKVLRPWYQRMMTSVRLMSPWSAMNRALLDEALSCNESKIPWDTDCLGVEPWQGQYLMVANNGTHLAVVDHNGAPLSRVPRFSIETPGSFDKLATVLRSLTMFQAIRLLTAYQLHSPLPAEWFSVRLFNKANRYHDTSSGGLQLCHGDVLSYVISNRTDSLPTYVHMLSLNASWSVATLLWNVGIPPRQQRTGDLTIAIPGKINDDDPLEAEDTILVIFCVGEQCAERLITSSEWLKSVYMPPVLLGPGSETNEAPVWPFFVPPPNWVVKHFNIRIMQRPEGGCGE